MKTTIIQKLDNLLALQHEDNTYQINLIKSIKQDLINEWNTSDDYAEQIRQVLDIDVTYELLNNLTIR